MPNGSAADRRKKKREQQRLNFPDGEPLSEINDGGDKGSHLNQQEKGGKQMAEKPPEKSDHWYGSAGFWTAIFTGILCLFTYLLYKVSNDANDLNAGAQRATVNFQGPYVSTKLSPDGKTVVGYKITYAWQNSGRNPAKHAESRFSDSLADLRPSNDTDFNSLPQRATMPLMIGPGNSYQLEPVELSVSDFEDVSQGKKHLFMWGWITYDDGLLHSSRRLTEFCMDVSSVDWTKPNHTDIGGGLMLITPPCGTHNCYDGDCKDYKERTESQQN